MSILSIQAHANNGTIQYNNSKLQSLRVILNSLNFLDPRCAFLDTSPFFGFIGNRPPIMKA